MSQSLIEPYQHKKLVIDKEIGAPLGYMDISKHAMLVKESIHSIIMAAKLWQLCIS